MLDTRAQRRQATTEKILKAAWRLARRDGLAAFSLRDLAKAVGMRAPSLYSYFDSKHALYDAMFEQGNRELVEMQASIPQTGDAHADFRASAHAWFEWSVADPVRYQLLFTRSIPGFEPSEASYALAVEVLERARATFAAIGLDRPEHLDLWTAIGSGLVNQQFANDPGGDRWARLIDDAVDMFLRHTGVIR